MNKSILATLLVFLVSASFAQETDTLDTKKEDKPTQITSKKGYNILPEKGDIAIGVNASPFFNLIGNIMKINSGGKFTDPFSLSYVNTGNTIYAKYFIDAKTAARAKIRISSSSLTENAYVDDDLYVGDAADYNKGTMDKMDKLTSSYSLITIGLGCEKRRGKNRLQGFYGAETLISFGSGSSTALNQKYDYGNDMSEDVASPTIWDFSAGNQTTSSARTLEVNQGSMFGVGLRGFIGAEYFFAPKISIGGEFGWGFAYTKTSDTEVTVEQWDAIKGAVETVNYNIGNNSGLVIDNDNIGGQIFLLLHF